MVKAAQQLDRALKGFARQCLDCCGVQRVRRYPEEREGGGVFWVRQVGESLVDIAIFIQGGDAIDRRDGEPRSQSLLAGSKSGFAVSSDSSVHHRMPSGFLPCFYGTLAIR